MRESVTYQEILQEGLQEGLQLGLQEGRQEGRQLGRKEGLVTIVLRLLTHKFGTVPPNLHNRIKRLHIPRLESLAEAILDFQNVTDLELWFNKKK
jgi:predicted transposase YdaD